jgi:hypothetical protein
MAHNKEHTPTQIYTLSIFDTLTNQFPKRFVILVGGMILKATYTIFTKGCEMNKS